MTILFSIGYLTELSFQSPFYQVAVGAKHVAFYCVVGSLLGILIAGCCQVVRSLYGQGARTIFMFFISAIFMLILFNLSKLIFRH